MCEEWMDYKIFKEWALNNGYKEDLSIERINVNGNYCPENCTWINVNDQQKNKTTSIKLVYGGKEQILSDWAKELGDFPETIAYRLRNGWSIEDSLFGKEHKEAPRQNPRKEIPSYLEHTV